MNLSFASPTGALIALAAALPVLALIAFEARARRLRAALQLPHPPVRAHVASLLSLVAIGVLLALAATQPVLARVTPRQVRSDAQVYAVFDVSLSMAAASGAAAPTRLERAKRLALRLRSALPDVPVGVTSFAVRTVPHLFPTLDEAVFAAVVDESVQILEPPAPSGSRPGLRVTDLASIAELGAKGYFAKEAKHRLVVVFTDGESERVFPESIAVAFRGPPRVRAIFVGISEAREEIHLPEGGIDPNYETDPTGVRLLDELAVATGGEAFSEHDRDGIVGRARADLGRGRTTSQGRNRSRTPLAPWLVLVAAVPLGIVLRRRNL
jgi:hypothetical protein